MRGQRHAPAAPYPRERPGTHCTGDWVGLRAGLKRCGKSRPTGIRSPNRPTRRQSLYRLRYPANKKLDIRGKNGGWKRNISKYETKRLYVYFMKWLFGRLQIMVWEWGAGCCFRYERRSWCADRPFLRTDRHSHCCVGVARSGQPHSHTCTTPFSKIVNIYLTTCFDFLRSCDRAS